MYKHALTGLAALGAWLAVVAPAPAATACPPKGLAPFAGSGKVSVYTRDKTIYTCRSAGGKSHKLGRTLNGAIIAVRAVQAAGRYVAFVTIHQPQSSQGPFYPQLIHLADGFTGRRIDIGANGCTPPPAQGEIIGSFGVTSYGAVAWICASHQDNGQGVTEVHKADACGAAVLASSAQLDPSGISYTSLGVSVPFDSLDHPIAYWADGVGAHAALLLQRRDCASGTGSAP